MAQSINANGWVEDDGNIVLCPVVGFKVKPVAGTACALQFNYFVSPEAVEKNEVRAVQLVMQVGDIESLRKALRNVEEHLLAQAASVTKA